MSSEIELTNSRPAADLNGDGFSGAQQAARFLKSIFNNTVSPIHVCVLANDRKETETFPFRQINMRDGAKIEGFVDHFDERGRSLYFCVGTLTAGTDDRNKRNIAELNFLWVDIDFKDVDDSRLDVERKIANLRYRPSYTVFTGHGIHCYWLLTEPINPQDDGVQPQVESDLRRLSDVVGGDLQVCEIARLMRLPGSHNSKFDDEWILVEVLTSNQLQYELTDLQDWLDEQSPIIFRKCREHALTAGQTARTDPHAEYGRAAPKLPIDVKSRLDAMLYMGEGDSAIHPTQISVTASMLSRGHDIDEVVEIILTATKAAAGEYGARWNWQAEERALRKDCNVWLEKLAAKGETPKLLKQVGPLEAITDIRRIDTPIVTQDHVARLFASRFDGQLRYCHNAGAWYEWTGSYWKRDEKAQAFHVVRQLSREFAETLRVPNRASIQSIAFANGVERFAKSDPILAVTNADWDQDFFLLGTPNGTVDLRTGKLREPDPADGISKITSVTPSDVAHCPRWERFLGETFGNDPAMIRFIKQWAGYCLTGDIREQALVFGTGDGGNGKGVLLHTLTGILKDYAVAATMQTFTASTHERHSTELAMLRGARMVTASETEKGKAWAEARIKQMTGGDPITCRFMRQDDFTYIPQFKLTIIGNHKPELRTVDAAARRRFNIVPFDRKPAIVDRELEAKLMGEAPGILRWMIEGCLDWQQHGLVRPQSVLDATNDYFSDQDSFASWLDEACDCEAGNKYKTEAATPLYQSWKAYALNAGEEPGTQKSFADKLKSAGRGIADKRTNKGVIYQGIRLRRAASFHDTGDDSPDVGHGKAPNF